MRTSKVVTAFIRNDDMFLILRRSDAVRTMRGLWAGVSGSIEDDEDPLYRAKTEIFEEVGMSEDIITLISTAKPITIRSSNYEGRQWEVFPFLFETVDSHVHLNWENSEYRWIRRQDLGKYSTVPGLDVLLGLF